MYIATVSVDTRCCICKLVSICKYVYAFNYRRRTTVISAIDYYTCTYIQNGMNYNVYWIEIRRYRRKSGIDILINSRSDR